MFCKNTTLFFSFAIVEVLTLTVFYLSYYKSFSLVFLALHLPFPVITAVIRVLFQEYGLDNLVL